MVPHGAFSLVLCVPAKRHFFPHVHAVPLPLSCHYLPHQHRPMQISTLTVVICLIVMWPLLSILVSLHLLKFLGSSEGRAVSVYISLYIGTLVPIYILHSGYCSSLSHTHETEMIIGVPQPHTTHIYHFKKIIRCENLGDGITNEPPELLS